MSDFSGSLSREEIVNIIQEIVSAERIVSIERNGVAEYFILIHPHAHIRALGEVIEKKALSKALLENYLSEQDIDEEILDTFFSSQEEEDLIEIQSKINAYSKLLNKRIKGSDQYKQDLDKIKNLQKTEEELLNKKNLVNNFTAEYKAREEKFLTLLSFSVLNIQDRSRIWSSYENMMDSESDLNFIYQLLNEFIGFYFGYDIKIIKEVARNSVWRNYFNSSLKGLIKLFDRETKDLTFNQLSILSWSMWYQDIFEMPYDDRPDENTINDDEALEKYLTLFTEKFKAERDVNKRTKGRGNSDSLSASKHDQVIVTAENRSYVQLHKEGMYSKTEIITGRSTKEGNTTYSEAEEYKRVRKKNS